MDCRVATVTSFTVVNVVDGPLTPSRNDGFHLARVASRYQVAEYHRVAADALAHLLDGPLRWEDAAGPFILRAMGAKLGFVLRPIQLVWRASVCDYEHAIHVVLVASKDVCSRNPGSHLGSRVCVW